MAQRKTSTRRRVRHLLTLFAPAPLCAVGVAVQKADGFSEFFFWFGLGIFPGMFFAVIPATAFTALLEWLHGRRFGLLAGVAAGVVVGAITGRIIMGDHDGSTDLVLNLTMLPACGASAGAVLAITSWLLRDPPHPTGPGSPLPAHHLPDPDRREG